MDKLTIPVSLELNGEPVSELHARKVPNSWRLKMLDRTQNNPYKMYNEILEYVVVEDVRINDFQKESNELEITINPIEVDGETIEKVHTKDVKAHEWCKLFSQCVTPQGGISQYKLAKKVIDRVIEEDVTMDDLGSELDKVTEKAINHISDNGPNQIDEVVERILTFLTS